jgi:uncharacterized membrane protein HdeD (DUF308 family)
MNPKHSTETIRHVVIDHPRIAVVTAVTIGLAGILLGIRKEYQRAKSRRAKWGILAFGLLFIIASVVMSIVAFSHMP